MKYSQKVLDHFMNPHNIGKLENPDISATEGSPACGDQVSIDLKINPKTLVIEDIGFQSYGCASNIATASIITDMAKGKTLEDAKQVTWKEAAEELDGLPPAKMHCSVLAVDTLRKAIKEYEISHGLAKAEAFSKLTIVKELKQVIYPKVGEDIVSLKMVKYVGFKEGVATVDVDVPSFDQYRENIAEEIREHLKQFPEITKVIVTL
ncbi:MAG: iron-sulfur cluster assembly scaffold protein [Candidatus Cloacimonetes bacterium]|nr:iron-sulfur cluster assembly scaffold protein [Candidatus Cloacimonadota bacterium]